MGLDLQSLNSNYGVIINNAQKKSQVHVRPALFYHGYGYSSDLARQVNNELIAGTCRNHRLFIAYIVRLDGEGRIDIFYGPSWPLRRIAYHRTLSTVNRRGLRRLHVEFEDMRRKALAVGLGDLGC